MRRTMVLRSDVSQRFDIELHDGRVIETRYRKGVPRPYVKEHASPAAAEQAFRKRLQTKRAEGFVHVAVEGEVEPNGLRLEARSAGGGGGGVLDLSTDGRWLAGADVEPQAYGCRVWVMNVESGLERTVLSRAAGPRQTFVHAALFDATASRLVVQLNDEVLLVDLEAGTERLLSAWREHQDSRFNPFVVRPVMNEARRRCAVPGANDEVSVVDLSTGEVVRQFSTRSATTECRGLALSPRGDALALYVPSRGLVYGHEDARHDPSNRVEVYDVDTGARRASFEPPSKLDLLGFGPHAEELWVTWASAQGPVCYDLVDGQERWRFADERRRDRLDLAFSCACSPVGLYAVGRDGLELYDARGPGRPTGPLPRLRLGHARVSRVVFSNDGVWLAAWGNGVAWVQRAPRLEP
ncbi:MAG: hypothetical protein SFW67_04200 [Myxococcaceae bacterium]|nr:hypothetical protein [Myxococcaceae bacterium]